MKYNLSEVNEVIRNRRTIFPEQFSGRKVHREIIEVLLENARWAPTHKMTQPWFFKVFREGGLQRLAVFQSQTYKRITPSDRFSESKFKKLAERPLKTSAIIAICLNRDLKERIPEIEEIASVSCAVQNMHLTATAYGIGAYWGSGGLTYTDEMKEFLGIGEKDRCLGFLYLGYPNIDWPRSQRRPIEYFTEWEE